MNDRQSAVGNRQSAVGNRQSAIDNRQSTMTGVRSHMPLTPDSSLSGDDDVVSAILLPAGVGLFSADRLFLALTHIRDAIAVDAEADEIVFRCARPAFSECKVVLSRAARIGMPLERQPNRRPAFQVLGISR